MSQTGRGSPWVTTTDGTNNTIVWVAGVAGDQRLHGYDGDTGAVIYAGGGTNELMTGTRQWNTGIVARGKIYFGADNKIYAFTLPAGTPTPTPTAITFCNCDSNCDCTDDSNCDSDYIHAYSNFQPHGYGSVQRLQPGQRLLPDRAQRRGRGPVQHRGRRPRRSMTIG